MMTLFYVFDPLCGWCFGFSSVIKQIEVRFHDTLRCDVYSGGMITGNRIGPIGEVASYISEAYKDVEQATGVRFGKSFLNGTLAKGTARFTSIPPSLAMTVFKTLSPNRRVEFASRLLHAIYYEGIVPEDTRAFAAIAGEFGLNEETFYSQLSDPHINALTVAEFQTVSTWGVQGFPTLLLETDTSLHLISRGYVPYSRLEAQLEQILSSL